MDTKNQLEIIDQDWLDYLSQYITDNKKSVMEKVLAQRTKFFTVVLEDIFKPHNASAVLRTCDCFGLQDVHVIEKMNAYKVNPFVTRGASQWIDLHKYYNKEGSAVQDCFSVLREQGYKIFGTSPLPGSISIHDLEPSEKIALVFGNEHDGISQEVHENVDGLVHIPMLGFTESFNISVAASISLYELVKKVKNYNHPDFYLTEEEKQLLRMKWYRSVVKRDDLHEKAYLKSKKS
ncbi:TrmH family RNA methyltransferase [Algoriphagus yeomjeoni]|uniref:tRNA (guanosine(18)-2'-O)-methyltransferase n=1 Tax=Algoriphagus yeomjeoni TaxID=291403 RepID=A0A327PNM0_9BACT|nr:RNA methyltransferase [Algoriphagus yeomjeoni]RAI93915.1 tRNA (guanosine-2'-O-)-methyltransferase [Algoriphagus yeomjeoni]